MPPARKFKNTRHYSKIVTQQASRPRILMLRMTVDRSDRRMLEDVVRSMFKFQLLLMHPQVGRIQVVSIVPFDEAVVPRLLGDWASQSSILLIFTPHIYWLW